MTSKLVQPKQLLISEGFTAPVGFYDAQPTFSWKLPADATVKSQSRYRIVVATSPELLPDNPDLWDSNVINSSATNFIPYQGLELSSRQHVFWQVKYWNEESIDSHWSEPASFELGLLSNNDWSGKWIEIEQSGPPLRDSFDTPIHIPQYLRTTFTADKSIKSARLYITAKGLFESFINGNRVGTDVLTPGYTPYHKRIETLTYDVTKLIASGENAIGITLAEGWYAGRFGPKRHWHKKQHVTPKALAQLEIEYVDGTRKVVVTNNSWQATQEGPLRRSSLYDGEIFDANFLLESDNASWNEPQYETENASAKWRSVRSSHIESDVLLEPKRHFTSKNKQFLTPVSLQRIDDKIIFDLGQNMVGVTRVNLPMTKGETLRLRFAEGINSDGSLYTKNLGSAAQEDSYIAAKSGVVDWQPQFTFHGFRFVEVSGFDEKEAPQLDWITGIVQYTDFELTGQFTSSDPKLNQLQSNIEWGLKGNFLDIPTDCPQRSERLGWTGDALAFAPTSLFIADSHAFWSAWLQSIREEQFEDHGIPVVVPNEVGEIVQAGWSDAAVTIPWDVYWRTGDERVLRENYAMMKRWILYHQGELENGISKMSTVGDWLQPYSTRKDSRRGETDHGLISTAFYARSLDIVARTATVLKESEDATYYAALFEEAKANFQEAFFDQQGNIKQGQPTQTSYLLAIGFELLSDEVLDAAKAHLMEQFEIAGGHLRTGFLGTPLIAPVLEKIGRQDFALALLFKDSYPSWLFPVSQGATTMWERWDGYTHDKGYVKKAGSLNHYAYGAIGQWMYDRLAGISPLSAGYKKVRIAPIVTTHLSHAGATYQSPHGEIKSYWFLSQDELRMEITIPPNVTASIEVPSVVHVKKIVGTASEIKKLNGVVMVNGSALNAEPTNGVQISQPFELPSGHYVIRVSENNE
ncbi:alpha-L-rhamnosidase [Alteromonas sp. LOR]|uniref:alpha-L-rhamnosidase n=1 Tax=Alteromonas sp. (strain LOR) TaxID=1537994 RepID=UPI001F475B25|nr:alpha-L-rhamnosidase [Alteromonas sp. LOR]